MWVHVMVVGPCFQQVQHVLLSWKVIKTCVSKYKYISFAMMHIFVQYIIKKNFWFVFIHLSKLYLWEYVQKRSSFIVLTKLTMVSLIILLCCVLSWTRFILIINWSVFFTFQINTSQSTHPHKKGPVMENYTRHLTSFFMVIYQAKHDLWGHINVGWENFSQWPIFQVK